MRRVLVTGATGLVGRALCDELARNGYHVRAALRAKGAAPASVAEAVLIGDITQEVTWAQALDGVDAVIHLAARAHILDRKPTDNSVYLETNAHATHRLALSAAAAGVRRLIYLSSVKVNGEETFESAFTALDEPAPKDGYARSKLLGERSVLAVSKQSGLEAVIVRSPLIYGPGVRANFMRLLQWVDRGWPIPFGKVRNVRSLVSVWNLNDLLVRLLEHPSACGRIWMVSDGKDLSTPELVQAMGRAMRRKVRVVAVPTELLRLAARALGRGDEIARLCGSLVVDISSTQQDLGWSPPMPIEKAMMRTANWYLTGDR